MGEGDLTGDAGQPGRLLVELGHLLEEVGEGVHDHLPAVGEVRRLVPVHVHQRLLHGQDLSGPGGPQQPLVVLGIAAGDVLVDEADPVEGGPGDHHGGGVGLHDPGAEQVGEGDPVGRVDPGHFLVLVADVDATGGHLGRRTGDHGRHLALELGRQPLVIVVAEGHELAHRRQHPAVAGAGQAGGAVVADHAQRPSLGHVHLGTDGLGLIEDEDALQVALVALLHDPLHGPAQQHRPLPGGDDDAYRGAPDDRVVTHFRSFCSSSRSGREGAR